MSACNHQKQGDWPVLVPADSYIVKQEIRLRSATSYLQVQTHQPTFLGGKQAPTTYRFSRIGQEDSLRLYLRNLVLREMDFIIPFESAEHGE